MTIEGPTITIDGQYTWSFYLTLLQDVAPAVAVIVLATGLLWRLWLERKSPSAW